MGLYYNAKGIGAGGTSNTVELLAPSSSIRVSAVNIANTHASNSATITLFVQNDPSSGTTSTYKILENISVPAKTSLLLDNEHILTHAFQFGLYIEIGTSDTLDVIVSQKR
jgi:hypothetical protein